MKKANITKKPLGAVDAPEIFGLRPLLWLFAEPKSAHKFVAADRYQRNSYLTEELLTENSYTQALFLIESLKQLKLTKAQETKLFNRAIKIITDPAMGAFPRTSLYRELMRASLRSSVIDAKVITARAYEEVIKTNSKYETAFEKAMDLIRTGAVAKIVGLPYKKFLSKAGKYSSSCDSELVPYINESIGEVESKSRMQLEESSLIKP